MGNFDYVPTQCGYHGPTLNVTHFGDSVGHLRRELIMKVVLPSISSSGAAAVIAASPNATNQKVLVQHFIN